eukprot:91803-Lingulodinium_polyedra.AAC.1
MCGWRKVVKRFAPKILVSSGPVRRVSVFAISAVVASRRCGLGGQPRLRRRGAARSLALACAGAPAAGVSWGRWRCT